MPPNSEIEKLERRWKENPKGTVFAPYAEVLRKHGDHLLARDVLRQGLELHPDHIPGNIVLGRCCLDLREDGPAEAAFHHVLDLDQENVIALKALADITERQGRLMEAATWLSRLISVDPSNDEARDQLARVDAAREAAAAAMSAPLTQSAGQAPEPTRGDDITEALPLVSRHAPPPPLPEAPTVEVATGQISEDADAALDARFSLFDDSPDKTVPIGLPSLGSHAAPPAPPAPVVEMIEPAALELVEPEPEPAPEPEPMPMMERTEFVPPESVTPEPSLETIDVGEVYAIGHEESSSIELRPSSATEFQTPDDSAALLELAPSGSEFQVPDASSELTLSSAGGTEYQTPSGADELLRTAQRTPEPEPEPMPVLEPEPLPEPEQTIRFDEEPRPYSKVVTTGFAAIELMPTQELPTEPAEAPLEIVEPEPASEPVEARFLEIESETVAAEEPAVEAVAEAEPEPEPAVVELEQEPVAASSLVEMLAAASTGEVVEESIPEPDAETVAAAEPESPLKLIFPEDSTEPEPPRHRRISEEVAAQPEPVASDHGIVEPAPVLTESMAELYMRQGHLAEALNVYRELSLRQPDDRRLQQRIADLQATLAAGSRRHSYVAMDTGGESVESFFRSLADARPAGSAASRPMVEDEQSGGAPTRPANDPLSLSAIFGDESASAATAAATGDAPSKPQAPDAFSFDQFFGAASGGASTSAPGGRPSQGEDLDQFQHWLKSLKK